MSVIFRNIFKELETNKFQQFDKWSGLLKYFISIFSLYFVGIEVFHFYKTQSFESVDFYANTIFLSSLILSYLISLKVRHNFVVFIPSLTCLFISIFSYGSSMNQTIPTWFSYQILGLFMTVLLTDFRGNMIYAGLSVCFPFFVKLTEPNIILSSVFLEQNLIYFGLLNTCFYSYFYSVKMRSEQKENESALLIKTASDLGTWQWNLKTNEVHYDERWLAILGYKPGELAEDLSTWEKLTHPNDRSKATKQFESYLSGESSEYEVKFRMRHKNGHWVSIISKGKVISRDSEGNPHYFSGTHFDLTKIEDLEEQNEKLNYLFETVQNLSNLGGWEFDVKNMQAQWTDQIFKIHGLPLGKLPSTEEAIQYFAPHERSRLEKIVEECIKTEKSFDETFEFVDANDEKKWIRFIGEAVKDQSGEVSKLRGVIQDITEQVNRENMASQAARLASLGKLARGIGHEINNPLAIVKGYIYLLQKNLENGPESYQEHFTKINQGVERIKNIVQGIKDFTDGDNEQHEIVDLGELIGSSINLMKDIHQKKGIKIENSFQDGQRVFINANRGKIQQVVQNLVSNAIDAVKDTENPLVKIYSIQDNSNITVYIEDNGEGIDPEIKNQIFDPFFSTKELNTAVGNGLAICHDIMQAHQAYIHVKSDPGKGSQFSFAFPIVQQEVLKAS